ncbi:sulfurtransferase complex subunit TusB [Metapseudomonas otitidis]|uniref:sulfurtransferase complex subunit TusB n=1 Tax=Metapseudomonas otitidis TaxID=319939 RepID=UPI001F4466F6|nr:sulfurtransferase complex subunit TusB [Pseudomonas otitidis]
MSTLHILSHSPFGDSRFASCLRVLGQGDALLLTGEAVQALRQGSAPRLKLDQLPAQVALFALEEDILARALTVLPSHCTTLDYPRFVALCLDYDKVNSWL